LSVYKYGSKVVAVPLELLQDSEVDIESFIRNRLAQRIGRITNLHFTVGSGVAQPKGAVTGATVGKVGATGTATSAGYDDFVDLEHSLDPAYRRMAGVRWMMHDNSLKAARKLKDTAGRPIWMPSYDAGIQSSYPDTLLGYPITINQDLATMAANAKSVLFGAFSYGYKIRDVMDVTVFRFSDSAYVKKGQIGFLAWMRCGGTVVDPQSIKYFQNSAT
jgi:HK97 family phage major capsid protein